MRAPILCAALAMLTACTQGGQAEVSTLVKTLAPTLLKSRAQIEADAALVNAAVVADPEGLRNFPAPILVVKAVDLNLVAVIGPLTTNGDESVWYSADNKSLGFRDGQVVATRGLDGTCNQRRSRIYAVPAARLCATTTIGRATKPSSGCAISARSPTRAWRMRQFWIDSIAPA